MRGWSGSSATRATLSRLSRELSERIRKGDFSLEDQRLRSHIKQSLADALAISNPKWLTR